ncbi:MAG: hypothetical protein U1E21_01260 [Reyranellaceae bacterium]
MAIALAPILDHLDAVRLSELTRFRAEHVDLLFDRANDNEPSCSRRYLATRSLHNSFPSSGRESDMAHVVDVKLLTCSCCGLEAVKKVWSCKCVTVELDEDAEACGDCDNFSDMRENNCGGSGWPGGD